MKNLLIPALFVALLAPAFVSASSFGIEPTLGQLLSRLAAVKAMESGKTIGCEVVATKTSVRAGETFTIGWGSYGADPLYSNDAKNAYTQNGQQTMRIDTPETRRYEFSFYGPNGTKADCQLTVAVIS